MTEYLSESRKSALRRLLDDESSAVRKAVIAELSRFGGEGISFLRSLCDGENRLLAEHARELLEYLGKQDTLAGFSRFIQSFQYELETGCLLLDRTVDPELDVGKVCAFIDDVALRCRELMVAPSSPAERCRVLNRVIFHEYGFRGDAENFYDPANSYLSQVIERRRGIPISLSILYLLVAQRCNLNLEPVGVPGRFMVGCFEGMEPFYIDAYESGHMRTADDVERFVLRNFGSVEPGSLHPSSVGEVLCRCCRNLVNQYQAAKNQKMVRLYTQFVDEFESAYRRQKQH